MSGLDNKIDWSTAPEGAMFFSGWSFRKHVDGGEYHWTGDDWILTVYETIEEHQTSTSDFEMRPSLNIDWFKENTTILTGQLAEPDINTETTQWTASHYDNYYQLTPADIKAGKVKIDAYFVNKMWKLNQKDDTGGLFHSLKTIARFGEKNPIERELKALYNQTKRMAELYGVELE